MAPAAAGPGALQCWRLGRALAAAATLVVPAPRAAAVLLQSRGQELSEISQGHVELLPGAELNGPDMPGLQDASGRSRAWEAREHGRPEAWRPGPVAPPATLGHFGVTLGLNPRARKDSPAAAAEVTTTELPRSELEASSLLRNGAAYRTRAMRQQPERFAAPTSYRQAMDNFGDVQYISHISVGHQQLTGILDTGSFELVVFSKKCSSCGKAAKYDPEESKNYKKGILKTGQSYGSGTCSSSDAWDTVSIGQFSTANQSFWEVTDAHMPILYSAAFQSIIGLGPPETPQSDAWTSANSVVHNVSMLLEKGELPPSTMTSMASTKTIIATMMLERRTILDNFHSPSFSVCIGKEPGSDGFFIWNDTSHLTMSQSFVRVQVVGKHTWSVKMTNARLAFKSEDFIQAELDRESEYSDRQTWWVRHKPLRRVQTSKRAFNTTRNNVMLGCDEGCSALVDSGTSLLSVPTVIIDKLMIAVQKLHTNCSNIKDLPNLEFELGGKRFSLPPDSYIVEVGSGAVPSYLSDFVRIRTLTSESDAYSKTHCELAVMETFSSGQFGPLWILGLPFFRNYYTTFSVGETKSERSLYMAHAGPDCFPVDKHTASQQPLQLYRRRVDLAKIWIPASAAKASSMREVLL